MKNDLSPQSGQQTHGCSKPGCYYCYYMRWQEYQNTSNRREAWTEYEIEFLLANQDKMGRREIAAALFRSVDSVYSKLHDLNKIKKTLSAA